MNKPIQRHFFTRLGGISRGIYSSLNAGIGSDDMAENVIENKARIARHFGLSPENLITLKQVHSAKIHLITANNMDAPRAQADAIITRATNVILGILTADCVPVLLQDKQAGVIAAAHAGWRGAFSGILQNTIQSMVQQGAQRAHIQAFLGPAIGQKSYEIGAEFRTRLCENQAENARYFIPALRADHYFFDLKAYVAGILAAENISDIAIHADDTCAMAEQYFSYRRSCLHNEADYGRQLSCIAMKE
jgi:YfiH family protein